jgi:hypothetical protein
MERVNITGLDRVRNPERTLKGHLILAYFTADIGPLAIKGCALVRQASGQLAVWLPNLTDSKAKTRRSISFNDTGTHNAVLQKALQTFRQLGGDENESRLAELHTIARPAQRDDADEETPDITLPRSLRREITVTRRVERAAIQEEPAE